jgi:hypothetical protein
MKQKEKEGKENREINGKEKRMVCEFKIRK